MAADFRIRLHDLAIQAKPDFCVTVCSRYDDNTYWITHALPLAHKIVLAEVKEYTRQGAWPRSSVLEHGETLSESGSLRYDKTFYN